MKSNHLIGFDGLRGISIVLVLVTHLGFLDQLDFDNYWVKRLLAIISGHTGVLIFFTLSGFLITKILTEEKLSRGYISLKNFFARRFLRLAPPLLVFYLVIFVLMYQDVIPTSYNSLLFAVFYVYNFVPNWYYTAELGHIWSLAVEEQFYILWPLFMNCVRENRKVTVTIFFVIICVIAQSILPLVSIPYNGKYYAISSIFALGHWFFPAVAPILIGCLGCFIVNSRSPFLRKLLSYLRSTPWGILLFFSPFLLPDFFLNYAYFVQVLGISLMLIWISYHQDSLFTKALAFWPLAYIGKISYGIYVYHGLFVRTGPGSKLTLQQFPINLILTLVVSIISFELYEKMILRFKEKFK